MDLKEVFTELGFEITEEQNKKLDEVFSKTIQSETDKVRTEYCKKMKELEQYKPVEKSQEQLELEQLKKELADTKFQKSLKDMGIDDSLAKFIRSDSNMEELQTFVKGFVQTTKDFIPNKNMGDNGITKEQFKNMSIAERSKIYMDNPELYSQLKQ